MFALDKPMGPTTVQALERLRAQDPALRGVKLGHAGRLDPLAEGLVVVLVGDETKDVHARRGESKAYAIDVLLGVATDSFDSLGLVLDAREARVGEAAVRDAAARWVGTVSQRCPPFSQARVNGRSMIAWGHAGVAVEAPTLTRHIADIEVSSLRQSHIGLIAEEAIARVALVRGDFRQDAIRARWAALGGDDRAVTVASLAVACSSGTYMRSLAADLGASLGVPAMAWRIRRTRVGDLTLAGARTLD